MRDPQACRVDHTFGDFVRAHAIGVIDFTGWVRFARRVGSVARVADRDEVDVEGVESRAEGVGVGCGRAGERQGQECHCDSNFH